MFGLFSKNMTWKVTAPPIPKPGTSRYSMTSRRLGSVPMTSNLIVPPPGGNRSSQCGATTVLAIVEGSGWLVNAVIACEKLRMPLLPMNSVVDPGVAPPNRIGNGDVMLVLQSSQFSAVSTVPAIGGNSNGTSRAGE